MLICTKFSQLTEKSVGLKTTKALHGIMHAGGQFSCNSFNFEITRKLLKRPLVTAKKLSRANKPLPNNNKADV